LGIGLGIRTHEPKIELNPCEVAQQIGVHQKTAFLLNHKVRLATSASASDLLLAENVEVYDQKLGS
jgi:hypothetical protein